MPKIIENDDSKVASEFSGKKTIKTRQSSEVVLYVLRARITQYLAEFLPLNQVQVYFHSPKEKVILNAPRYPRGAFLKDLVSGN